MTRHPPLLAKILILVGVLLGSLDSYVMIALSFAGSVGRIDGVVIFFGMLFIAIMLILWGMWHLKKWAFWGSMALVVVAWLWPAYGVLYPYLHPSPYYWHSPGALGRALRAVLSWGVFPIIWIIYFSRPQVRTLFLSSKQRDLSRP